jgi:uncharacterized protein YndB with AHSA1/START domain
LKEILVRTILYAVTCVALFVVVRPTPAADQPAAKSPGRHLDPTLVKLSGLIGGIWSNHDPKFLVEFHSEWAYGQTAIRGAGVIGKGGPQETQVDVTLGWDPARKVVYYVDNHGGNSVYQGTVTLKDDELVYEFETLVGKPAKWRSVARFPDPDTYRFTIYGQKEGKWSPIVEQALKRANPSDESRQVTEAMVDAPLDAVWDAMTTKAGLESWNVAHAEVDLRVGGKMLTHYQADGKIGDPNTIENIVLAVDPKHMYAIQVGSPPEKFPFKEAVKKVWHVIYLDEVGPRQTRVRVVGVGYGNDPESKKLRGFFEKGNAYTMQKLQQKFAKQ